MCSLAHGHKEAHTNVKLTETRFHLIKVVILYLFETENLLKLGYLEPHVTRNSRTETAGIKELRGARVLFLFLS